MRTRTIIVGLAISVAGLATAQPAAAEERTCRGTIGRVTVDNVRVPAGATCTLNGTRVQGTVYVNRNATLRAVGARINGNVQAENSRDVRVVQGWTVGGSYQVVQSGLARLFDSRVEGDVLIDENRRPNEIRRNRVGGNIQAFQNTGWGGDLPQHGGRQPAVQAEPAGPHRRRQSGPRQQGGPVPPLLS